MSYLKNSLNQVKMCLLYSLNIIPDLFKKKTTWIVLGLIIILSRFNLEKILSIFLGIFIGLYLYYNYCKDIDDTPKEIIKEIEKDSLFFSKEYDFKKTASGYSVLNINYPTGFGYTLNELTISISNKIQNLEISIFDSNGHFVNTVTKDVPIGTVISKEFIESLVE